MRAAASAAPDHAGRSPAATPGDAFKRILTFLSPDNPARVHPGATRSASAIRALPELDGPKYFAAGGTLTPDRASGSLFANVATGLAAFSVEFAIAKNNGSGTFIYISQT